MPQPSSICPVYRDGLHRFLDGSHGHVQVPWRQLLDELHIQLALLGLRMPNVFSHEVTARRHPVGPLVVCRERSKTCDNATGPVLALVAMDEERMVARVGDDPHDLGEISHRDGLAVLVRRDGDPVVFDLRGSQPRRCGQVKLRRNERDNGPELHAPEEFQVCLVGERAAENASGDDAEVRWRPVVSG